MTTNNNLVFLDTETTGLNPVHHQLLEVAFIVRSLDRKLENDREFLWYFLDRDLAAADASALRVNRWYQRDPRDFAATPDTVVTPVSRTPAPNHVSYQEAAGEMAVLLAGARVVGLCPDFDIAFLTIFLRLYGHTAAHDHHLLDLSSMSHGFLAARGEPFEPRSSVALAQAVGAPPPGPDQHTALGDARWNKYWWDALHEKSR